MLVVRGLTRGQLLELKQCLLFDRMVENGDWPSYGELANADETITDEAVFAAYEGTVFSPDDFCCSVGM